MKDINRFINWHYAPNACGTAVYPRAIGLLSSRGSSHYGCIPDYFCLHIITRGKGMVRTGGIEKEMTPGMMFIQWPEVHAEYFEKPGAFWEFHWIHATGPGAETFVNACGFDREHLFLDKPFDAHKVESLIHGVWQSVALNEGPSAALSQFYALPEACLGKIPEQRTGGIVEEAVRIMEDLMYTGININEIAEQLKIGRVSLFQAFKRKYKCSPGAYFEGLRMNKAKDLLVNTERSIETVASSIGYSDAHYFSRRFRELEGMSPRDFRNSSHSKPAP